MPKIEASLGMAEDQRIKEGEDDDLEQLLHQIEVEVTVNGSTEFIELETAPKIPFKHEPTDNAQPATMKVVDSQENPTQLYLRINYRLWDMAAKVLHQNPAEASTWIEQSSSDNPKKVISRNLPLHLICQQGPNPAPVALVNKLLAAYPQAIQTRNLDGDLPIHIACRNPAFRGMEGASVLMALAEAYPKSMEAMSGENGPTPWTILENHHGAMSPHGATISKMLQVKLGTNRPRPVRPRVKKDTRALSRVPPELIAKEGSDIASELNRRRLSVLMHDVKDAELSSLSQEKVNRSTEGNLLAGKESRDEECNHETIPLHLNPEITASPTNPSDSLDNLRRKNRESRTEQTALKQSKTMQDIDLLKRKLDELREENFSNQVNRREMEATIEVLRKAVEQEREACRVQIKATEAQVTSLQDQLLLAQEKMSTKARSEQELFKRVLHLESSLAEKKAELATMKTSIQELGSAKAMLQQSIQLKKEKLGILQDELHVKNEEIACLIDKSESSRVETSKLVELSTAAQNKAVELAQSLKEKERAVDERDIQIRALTEARRASEKRMKELEESNLTLRSKNSSLSDVIRKHQESLNVMEIAMNSQRTDNESLQEKLLEATTQCAAKDREIDELTKRKVESLSIEKSLEEMTSSFNLLQEKNESLGMEVVRLSEALSKAEVDCMEKDEIILEIERSNALLQRELDTLRECRSSQDDLTKKLIEEQVSIGLQKLTTKNKAYKAELKRLLSVNAVEAQKSSQYLNRIASLEEKLAASETNGAEYDEECNKLRQTIESYKDKCESLKQELNRLRSVHLTQIATTSDLENTICNLKDKNRDLSERCEELRSVFCARVEKIEASSDLHNDLRIKNEALQEECELLRQHGMAKQESIAVLAKELEATGDKIRDLQQVAATRALEIASFLVEMGDTHPSEMVPTSEPDDRSVEGLAISIQDLMEKSMLLQRKVEELVEVRNSLNNEVLILKRCEAELNRKSNDLDANFCQCKRNLAEELSKNTLLQETFEQSERKLGEVETQLGLSMAENLGLRTEVADYVRKNTILQKEKDESWTSLKESNEKFDRSERRASSFEKALLELFDHISLASSSNLVKWNSPSAQGEQTSLVDRAKVAAQQLLGLADEMVALKEAASALREQVDDWRVSAVELRSKNGDLAEKLKKESEELQTALSKSSQLSCERDLIATELSSLKEEHRSAKTEIDELRKIWKEANDLVLVALGAASIEPESQEAKSVGCTLKQFASVPSGTVRNIAILIERFETVNKDRAAYELKADQMADTILTQESQIAGLEETIRLFCDTDAGLETSIQSKIDGLRVEISGLRKENAALEREVAQLRIVNENSKACNHSISTLLAKIGLSSMSKNSSDDENPEAADDENIRALITNIVCLEERLEEIGIDLCTTHAYITKEARTFNDKLTVGCGQEGEVHDTHSVTLSVDESSPRALQDIKDEPDSNNGCSNGRKGSEIPVSSECEFYKQAQKHFNSNTDRSSHQTQGFEELLAANRALRLENKVLKTVGKRLDDDAAKVHEKLRDENETLKDSISRLTVQTVEHQQRIRQLAKRQAELVRKKQTTCRKCQPNDNSDISESPFSTFEGNEVLKASTEVVSERPDNDDPASTEGGNEKPKEDSESRDDEPPSLG